MFPSLLETGFQNLVGAQYGHLSQTDPIQTGGVAPKYTTSSFNLSTGLSNSLSGFVVGFKILPGS